MAQVKIYGLNCTLVKFREDLSDAIHQSIMTALEYPVEKRFHRFIPLERENFIHPADRSDHYLILEISLFEGRTTETKKQLIKLLFSHITAATGITKNDIEITLFETPKSHWGIRGLPGDELALNYKVEV